MQENSLEMLEFNKVLDILAEYSSFSLSRSMVLDLKPSTHVEVVKLRLDQTAEACRLLSLRPNFSIGHAVDIRQDVWKAAKGSTLEARALLQIKDTLAACHNVLNNLKKLGAELKILWQIAERMHDLHEVTNEIDKCIDVAGEIKDSASPLLATLRAQFRERKQLLMLKLEAIIKSTSGQKFVQEAYVTERDSRWVIPVKADFKKEIRGIVHDISNTGNTVFVEPLEVVEQGNELRQTSLEEKQEVWRILSQLSGTIGAKEIEITSNIEILAEIDVLLAKARYAEAVKAVGSRLDVHRLNGDGVISENNHIRLEKARHPLLKGTAVPLDVEIGKDFRIMVITGPNAGGKTVALKTVGLLAIMTQAGIPITASGNSLLPVFDGIYADIGDQQSIEQTLSTFSWHIGNIADIMRKSTRESLILLDELGISTDPEEGSALARSILLDLLEKGCLVVATTHYNDLKAFAHITPGMRNASLDFDPVSLLPTYKLHTGTPGRSNAISVAERLGLPNVVIERAKGMLKQGSHEIDLFLADLQRQKHEYVELLSKLDVDSQKLARLEQKLRQDEANLAKKEYTLMNEVSDTLMQETARLQRAVREAEAELKRRAKRESIEKAKKLSVKIQAELDDKMVKASSLLGQEMAAARIEAGLGDTVRVRNRNIEGTLVAIDEKNRVVEVRVGNTRFKLDLGEIEEAIRFPTQPVYDHSHLLQRERGSSALSIELDLRGRRADEVGVELDRFLNDAFLARLGRVRIIHGFATGTVRKIVRETLAEHPLVAAFQPGGKDDGGDGVTLVDITT